MLPRAILTFLIICTLGACSQLAYYSQAARGQWQIVSNRQDIRLLLEDPVVSGELKKKLQLSQEIRNFAVNELDLPDNRSFRLYADLGRRYAVWNVIATPAYEIDPKTWCFPIAGCVAYKGFFSEEDAIALKTALVDQGYDTYLYGVSAYSTLGWFSDPVLNTFIDYSELSLAALIFHELAHQVVYVKDDSAFNEAFATAVEYAGVQEWIKLNHSEDMLDKYYKQQMNSDQITEMILDYRGKLSGLYMNYSESGVGELKAKLFKNMKQDYARIQEQGKGTRFYDWWFGLDLNNAHVSSITTYHRLVPGILQVFENSGSFSAFFETVRELAIMPKTERDEWLSQAVKNSI